MIVLIALGLILYFMGFAIVWSYSLQLEYALVGAFLILCWMILVPAVVVQLLIWGN